MSGLSEAARLLWLRIRLRGRSVREAERWLRREGGMSRSQACEYISRHKHELGLRDA